MEHYKVLFELSKKLQAEHRYENLPNLLLEEVVKAIGAAKGFIVVQEENGYNEKFHIRFDRSGLSKHKRQFSRTLVRNCIKTRDLIFSQDIAADDRFNEALSVRNMKRISILVVPLMHDGEVNAVIYLEKPEGAGPFTEDERLVVTEFAQMAGLALHAAIEREALQAYKRDYEELFERHDFSEVIGAHPKMMELLDQVAQVADSDATVLIQGETGSGKEVIARAIYRNSSRRNKPFVTLHCGALPETLFESELFGHRKGAFTGAVRDRAGRIAQAQGGTLFIDEVAEMPITVQAKLLRFFQFGEFQRIGSDKVETTDIRILTATHRDIPTMIKAGTFREDLYYRLKVVNLKIPPLRERKDDIRLLLEVFLKRHWSRPGKAELSPQAMQALLAYDFPGNVRELAHIVERICLLAKDQTIPVSLLPEEVLNHIRKTRGESGLDDFAFGFQKLTNDELKEARQRVTEQAVTEVECFFLNTLMDRHQGNIAEAAEAAGMQKTYLYKLLGKHNLR